MYDEIISTLLRKSDARGDKAYNVVDLETTDMHAEFVTFARAVVKKIPGSYLIKRTIDTRTAYVALDGYPFTLGQIFIDSTYRGSHSAKRTFIVKSSNIRLARGSDRSSKESVQLKAAVKNAATYLRPNKAGANMLELVTYCEPKMHHTNNTLYRDRIVARRAAFGDNPSPEVVEELMYLYNIEAPFKSQKLRELITGYTNADTKYAESIANKSCEAVAVMAVPNRKGEVKACMLMPIKKYDGVTSSYKVKKPDDGETYPVTVSVDKLPQVVQDALPLIDMVDTGEYVEDIGIKTRGGFYIVEIHDVDGI